MRRPSSWASTTTRRARSVNRSNNVSLPPCSGDPWDESTHGPPEATQGDLDLPVTVHIGTSDRPHERHAAAGASRRVSDPIRRGTSFAGVVGPNHPMKLHCMERHRDTLNRDLPAAAGDADETPRPR